MVPFLTVRQTSKSYPIFIGEGLLDSLHEIAGHVAPSMTPVLLTSQNVEQLYGARARGSFQTAPATVIFNDGENQKTLETVHSMLTELFAAGFHRDTLAIALGGGVVGDTTGFVASIFLRGVPLLHVPTTLLSMVDSSIGGKVGVNHALGKNLIGSFHFPQAVVADTLTLQTLPRRELRSGLFEALKSGVILDPSLFETIALSREAVFRAEPETLTFIIQKSLKVKAGIVSEDERENGRRRLLNYGHTIGHAIEVALDYEGITHGDAVAWGMIAANAIAAKRGVLSELDRQQIDRVILDYQPEEIAGGLRDQIIRSTALDKKFIAKKRVMILPRAVGRCEIDDDITEQELHYGVEAISSR